MEETSSLVTPYKEERKTRSDFGENGFDYAQLEKHLKAEASQASVF